MNRNCWQFLVNPFSEYFHVLWVWTTVYKEKNCMQSDLGISQVMKCLEITWVENKCLTSSVDCLNWFIHAVETIGFVRFFFYFSKTKLLIVWTYCSGIMVKIFLFLSSKKLGLIIPKDTVAHNLVTLALHSGWLLSNPKSFVYFIFAHYITHCHTVKMSLLSFMKFKNW